MSKADADPLRPNRSSNHNISRQRGFIRPHQAQSPGDCEVRHCRSIVTHPMNALGVRCDPNNRIGQLPNCMWDRPLVVGTRGATMQGFIARMTPINFFKCSAPTCPPQPPPTNGSSRACGRVISDFTRRMRDQSCPGSHRCSKGARRAPRK